MLVYNACVLAVLIIGVQQVRACPRGCTCPINNAINCSGNGRHDRDADSFFNSIPPSTQHVDLSENSLTRIRLGDLVHLETARFAHNAIGDIHGSNIPSALVQLDISNNVLITLDEGVFASCGNLTHLNLSSNHLANVTVEFQSLHNLLSLDLSHNNLAHMRQDAFQAQTNLTYLDLSSNNLRQVQHEWFLLTTKLQRLDMHDNRLMELNNLVFSKLRSLVELNLSNNEIESLGKLTFKGLTNVKKIDLSKNRLHVLPSGGFKHVPNLQYLDISSNPIQSLGEAFVDMKAINWTLRLDNLMKLRRLRPSDTAGLESLLHLSLANGSYLEEINRNTLDKLTVLETLDLTGNNLTVIPAGILFGLRNLKNLVLRNNPWQCDCTMYWLLSWLGDNVDLHLSDSQRTHCGYPKVLKNEPLLDALDKKIICQNATITNFTRRAHYRLTYSARLRCDFKGVPTPRLRWITQHGQELEVPTNAIATATTAASTVLINETSAGEEYLPRIRLDGNDLIIDRVQRGDSGYYRCVVTNVLNSQTAFIHLTLDYDFLNDVKIMSILVGLASCVAFIICTGIGLLTERILIHFGLKCPCDADGPIRRRNVYNVLESIENYKRIQLERLRENYTAQVQRIRDNCSQQLDRIRESYNGQTERVRTYGSSQLGYIRDGYSVQVQRVRDYGNTQMDWVRENYVFQRNRIRKFSTHQLIRLRENYKIQQKHLNKILENLPKLENCGRNGCGGSADSVLSVLPTILIPPPPPLENILEFPDPDEFSLPELHPDDISAYFTPEVASLNSSLNSLNSPRSNRSYDTPLSIVRPDDLTCQSFEPFFAPRDSSEKNDEAV